MDIEKKWTYATRRRSNAIEIFKKRRYLREVEMEERYYKAA
jgi:hypothetical protein